MAEQPTPEALVARSSRFVVRLPDNTVLHGVQFPSGSVIADDPVTGLIAAESTEHLLGTQDVGRVEWVAEPSAIEQRLRAFVAELELAERAAQEPLPDDLLIATLRHRVLDPRTPDTTGPEIAGATT